MSGARRRFRCRHLLWLAAALCLPIRPAAAEDPAAVFAAANDAYRAGRYDEAVQAYRGLIRGPHTPPAVYYNLGNSLLKAQQPAEALWAYRNALALRPRDPDIRANLAHAQDQLSDAAGQSVQPPRAVRWLTVDGRWTTRELAIAWIVVLWLACASRLIAAWSASARPLSSAMKWLAGVAVLLGAALVAQTWAIDEVPRAVVVSPQAAVRFAPQESGTVHYTLPAGAVVRINQRQRDWMQVQRADGRAGWITEQQLRPLNRGA